MKEKAAKLIRVMTLPPIMALWLVLILWRQYAPAHAWLAILFLTMLPILPYPLQKASPRLAAQGRTMQRRMAIIFSVIGYAAGLVFCLASHGSRTELLVYLCYIFSGTLIAIFTKCLKIKSSGHAAGTAGPITILVLRVSPWFLLGYLLLIPVYCSSLRLKRHTMKELLWGTAYPIVAAIALELLIH